jgi:hypothetical protein
MDETSLASQVHALQGQLHRLLAVESIRRLKFAYWRAVRTGRPEDVGRCFSRDARFDYGAASPLIGREAITGFFRQVLADPVAVVLHGHNAEIDVTSPTTAHGLWQLENMRILEDGSGTRMGNGYVEDYVVEDGEWKVASSTVEYLYHEPIQVQKITGLPARSQK